MRGPSARLALLALLALLPDPGAAARSAPTTPAARPTASRPAPTPAAPAAGFDHITHDDWVSARAAAAIACRDCHATDDHGRLRGAPGHAACFGACHGARPAARDLTKDLADPARAAVCRACHAPAELARARRGATPRVAYPPYTLDPEFAIVLTHQRHAGLAGGCRACHGNLRDDGSSPATAPHARCTPCHAAAGATTSMSACATCHTSAVGPKRGPRAEPGAAPVAARFRHRSHLARITGAGDPCLTCHGAVAREASDTLPTPKQADCAGCHDGSHAFSMVTPRCRACHSEPARPEPSTELARQHFDHRGHAARGQVDCRGCHPLDQGGKLGPPARDHTPCADAGCHARAFAGAASSVCGVCHVAVEPWRPNHLDPPPGDGGELGARFSHRAHLGDGGAAAGRACTTCHTAGPDGRVAARAADHAGCKGGGCHALAGGAAPHLADCGGCHVLGLLARHERAARDREFSVRARFDHRPHRVDGAGHDLACETCHASVLQADGLDDLAPPTKSACAPCHDGKAAFKLTGHGCVRCHGSGKTL